MEEIITTRELEQIPEWELNFEKGGPGSGEPVGHPYRGNQFTSGVGGAEHSKYFNPRPGTEGWHHGQHLEAASAHMAAAKEAMSHRNFSLAKTHFNEAAYHATTAASKLQTRGGFTHRGLGGQADMLYTAAHLAGNAAGQLSGHQTGITTGASSVHDYERAVQAANETAAAADQANRGVQAFRSIAEDPTLNTGAGTGS